MCSVWSDDQIPSFKRIIDKLPVIAVGKLDDAHLAEATLANEDADLVAIGRGMLNDPYWALHAIKTIAHTVEPPVQYERGIYIRR